MSITSSLTVNTVDFALVEQKPNASKRSVAGNQPNEDQNLIISHEVQKDGRTSSVVIFEDILVPAIDAATGIVPKQDSIRAMVKIQYSESTTRADSLADINAVIANLVTIMSDPAIVAKLLNKET